MKPTRLTLAIFAAALFLVGINTAHAAPSAACPSIDSMTFVTIPALREGTNLSYIRHFWRNGPYSSKDDLSLECLQAVVAEKNSIPNSDYGWRHLPAGKSLSVPVSVAEAVLLKEKDVEIGRLNTVIADLRAQIGELTARVSNLVAEAKDATARFLNLQGTLQQQVAIAKTALDERDTARKDLAASNVLNAKLRATIDQNVKRLAAAEQTAATAQKKVNDFGLLVLLGLIVAGIIGYIIYLFTQSDRRAAKAVA